MAVKDDFEARLLALWINTRIPLTRANVVYCTKAPRKKAEKWLNEMTREGVLDVDSSDDGELVWTVRGADRSPNGPATIAELERRDKLAAQVGGSTALVLAREAARPLAKRQPAGTPAEAGAQPKSIAMSAVLSFALGPIGWLYAAPFRTAVPFAAGFALAVKILPSFLLLPILGLVMPASALVGAAYAWRYNQRGERTPILPPKDG
jgi:hypothetical protein